MSVADSSFELWAPPLILFIGDIIVQICAVNANAFSKSDRFDAAMGDQAADLPHTQA
jgi:hypothetical protein